MGIINQELGNFKDTIGPLIDNMNSTYNILQDKIQMLSINTKTTRERIHNYYKSSNKVKVLDSISKMDNLLSEISMSIDNELKDIITDSYELVTMINELEEINIEIKNQEGIIKTSDSSVQNTDIINAQNIINSKNIEFNEKHNLALNKLNMMKNKNNRINFINENSNKNTNIDKKDLSYGTLESNKFTASNGVTIDYYLYVPHNGKEVDNLPVMLYMHGRTSNPNLSLDEAVQHGLSSKIIKQEEIPSGFVIMPAVRNFSDEGVKALKELTDAVVAQNHCDTNRISVSGHSMGGITAYKLVNNYPGYFSCCVPISGSYKVTDAFKDTKVWAFNGTMEKEDSSTSYDSCVRTVNAINSIGGNAYMTALKTGHVGTNNTTYGNIYESPDGEMIDPLEWAFKQTKKIS